MRKIKILFYDVETSPNLGWTWQKYEQNVIAFEKERELLSYAYSWLGDKKVHFDSRKGERSDKRLITNLKDLLESADIVVAHNGDAFDNKVAKTRMLFHRMKPLRILCSVDTKKVAKLYFNFNGNGLDDLSRFLSLGKKLPNKGFEMWKGCMENDPTSWREMERYNKHDIVLLKKAYRRMQPWIENHPNVTRMLRPYLTDIGVCPRCGTKDVVKRGIRGTARSVQQQWHCRRCFRWFLSRLPKRGERGGR
jgi:uncharacterized protein YprB with RNaseH-like and TPR domain